MKFFIIFLNFFAIQLLTLVLANPLPADIDKEYLLDLYDNELQTLAKDFSEQAKNISENLLKNEDFNRNSTVEQKELNKSLQAFLTDYPHAKRFGVYEPILITFINLMNNTQENPEFNTKFQHLLKQHFAIVIKDYEENYKKFIKEKFLVKTEDFKKQLSSKEIKEMPNLNQFLEKLKNCQNYQCLPTDHDSLLVAFNASNDLLIKYSKLDMEKGTTFTYIRLNNVVKNVLNNKTELDKLEADCRQNITNFMNELVTFFENTNDLDKFLTFNKEKLKISENPEFESEFCPKDREFFKTIFNKPDAEKSKYELENDVVVSGLNAKLIIFSLISAISKGFDFMG